MSIFPSDIKSNSLSILSSSKGKGQGYQQQGGALGPYLFPSFHSSSFYNGLCNNKDYTTTRAEPVLTYNVAILTYLKGYC